MKMFSIKDIIYNCKRATFLMIKKEESRLNIYEKLRLKYHKSICESCRNFEKQSGIIDEMLQGNITDEDIKLTEEYKQRLEKLIQENCKYG